ncbi:hypothetical protein BDF19DRAFT_433393 [Syncephalis fuscata]|nr:hypothetical protein BDF19DRAFT_433393 [Syncephalis fuscata]
MVLLSYESSWRTAACIYCLSLHGTRFLFLLWASLGYSSRSNIFINTHKYCTI